MIPDRLGAARWPDFIYPELSQTDLWLIAIGLLLLALAVLWYLAWDALRAREEKRTSLRRLAADHAAEKDLTPEEAALLERIVLAEGAFPGPRGFEREVERLLREGVSPETIGSLRLKTGFARPRAGRPLASTREIEIGQDVTLTDAERVWRAGVVDVDETALTLKVPPEAAAALRPGQNVKVSFWRDHDARYYFQTTVRGVRARPAPLVVLVHPGKIDRFQDREYVRANVDWRLTVTRLTEEEFQRALRGPLYAEAIEGRPIEAEAIDISAGGIRLRPVEGLAPNDHLVIPIPSDERKGPLLVLARVVASDDRSTRCEFLSLTMNERDEIHRLILRERRGRGAAGLNR